MKQLIQIIEDHGLEVTHNNKRHLWIKAFDSIIRVDSYDLFGLADDDLMLRIKHRFYNVYRIRIDTINPENNKGKKSKNKKVTPKYIPVGERKENIRKLLTDKFKLLP